MDIDFAVLWHYRLVFAEGFATTVLVCGAGTALALAGGLVVGIARLSPNPALSGVALAYVEISRNLPFMVLLFLMFFGLPVLGAHLPAYLIGAVALALYGSAYFGEIYRAAILSVPRGQWDAAEALGMTRWRILRSVVLPQAMGFFIPPATNQAIMLLKESAVLSVITVVELTMAGHVVTGYTYRPIEIFVLVAVLYWTLTALIARAGRLLEARTERHLQKVQL
jgi:His/Glu/Gln/Arg/opine family amino acid ABC transporter permease subunit